MQPADYPGSWKTTCREGMNSESTDPLAGRLRAPDSEGVEHNRLRREIPTCLRVGRMGPYNVTTFDNVKPFRFDYSFFQEDAWKYTRPGAEPRVLDDNLDFWKGVLEAAILSIPVLGEVILVAQAITGRNIYGEKISSVERVIDGILALIPVAGGLIAKAAAREGVAALATLAAKVGRNEGEVLAMLRAVEQEGPAAAELTRWKQTLEAGGRLAAAESSRLVTLIRQIDIDARSFLGAAQSPTLKWTPNPGGQVRTVDEAVKIAREVGVVIPDDIKFAVGRGPWPEGRWAEYLQFGKNLKGGRERDLNSFIEWTEFYNQYEMIPVRLRPETWPRTRRSSPSWDTRCTS
jgi:hypothetical protein